MSLGEWLHRIWIGFVLVCMFGTAHMPQGAHGQPRPDTIHLMVPQFVAEAVRFTAVDESGYDSFGSDEVYAVFSDLNPRISDLVTATYGNVDTGDTRDFGRNERCITPRPACDKGVSEILYFEVSFWERDEPPWPFAEFCYGDIPGLHYYLRHGVCSDDDLIGNRSVIRTREQLLADLPDVGDSVEYKLVLGGPCGPTEGLCGAGWPGPTGPEYELTYRIRRLPDVERPIVIAPPR